MWGLELNPTSNPLLSQVRMQNVWFWILHQIYTQDVDENHLSKVFSDVGCGIEFCSENAMLINVD